MELGMKVSQVMGEKPQTRTAYKFFLKSIHPSSKGTVSICASFSSTIDKSGKQTLILPTFNTMKTSLYNSFQVNQREAHSSSQNYSFGQYFKGMVNEIEPEISTEILAPKPQTSFCYLCKMKYEDYLKHIDLDIHKLRANKTQISGEFRNMVNMYLSSSSRRAKLADYEKEDMDIGHSQPTKRRAVEETPSLLGNAISY